VDARRFFCAFLRESDGMNCLHPPIVLLKIALILAQNLV